MINAGCIWEDAEVVVDRNLVTSRTPDDLPAFCRTFIDVAAGKAAAVGAKTTSGKAAVAGGKKR